MKTLLSLCALTAFAASAFADIQDPPMNDQGPTRKLARGIANLAFGSAEIFDTVCKINDREGNAEAATYGVIRGVGKTLLRIRYGVYDVLTFPFPTTRSSYRAPYKSDVPWIHGGMSEFPPELGFQSRYRYVRGNYGY